MSEGSERKLENVAPEAEEKIEQTAEAEVIADSAPEAQVDSPKAEDAPEAQIDSPKAEREKAPARKRGKKKRNRRAALVPLVIALVVALLAFGILVGYGLGKVRGARKLEAAQNQVDQLTAGLEAADNAAPYDAFQEELTNENQQALDALAGVDAPQGQDAGALLGEDEFFDAAPEEAQAASEPVVVAEFGNGQTLMSDEVLETYNEQLADYILSGYSESEIAETLLDDVLHTMVADRVRAQHAQEMGLYELSQEDRAQIEAQANQTYDEYVAYCRESEIDTDGMTDEEATGAAKAYLQENEGISYDYIAADLEQSWWEQKLYDALTADVTVDDAAVQAAYDERLAEQKANFTEYPDDFEFSQQNGEIIVYNPSGYRAVKVLLLGFDDVEAAMAVYALTDELSLMDEGAEAQDAAQRQAELDGYYAGPEARARQALEQLRNGADMDEMILSIGADDGMRDERQREMGYYVSAGSMLWSEDFVRAAMALENAGDYSEPVRVEDGVCILQYLGEVPEGEVPLADVRDALTEELLEAARDDAYQSQVDAWMDEANPSYYPERMQ